MVESSRSSEEGARSGSDDRRVLIIGGGVVAAATAYYLAKGGRKVSIVEAGQFGGGCSHGNCGYVSPSHVLPLAAPGAIKTVAKAILKGNGAVAVKPRFDPSLWSWLLHFARRCRQDCMLRAAQGRHALLQSSRSLYAQLMASEPFDCEWEEQGLLFVYNSGSDFEKYGATNDLIAEHFGVAAMRYDGDQLVELEPALKPGLAGAWRYDCDSHLRPDRLMSSWRAVLQRLGVEIIEQTSVDAIQRDRHRVLQLETSRGRMTADVYVLAAGARSPQLSRQVGVSLPIQPGKGYSITMPRPSIAPKMPMILEEYHVGVTPWASGYRVGSTMEFAGYDDSLNPRRLALLRKGAENCLREPFCEPVLEQWCGWRPMTYDGLPCVGPAPGLDNLFVAAGHGMLGVSMSPGTGRLIAELVADDEPHVDPAPYAPARFAK